MADSDTPVDETSNDTPVDETGTKTPPADLDHGQAEMQEVVNAIHEDGFWGTKVDPTPNHHYSVEGVTSGLPTPETDFDHADEVAAHQRRLSRNQEVR